MLLGTQEETPKADCILAWPCRTVETPRCILVLLLPSASGMLDRWTAGAVAMARASLGAKIQMLDVQGLGASVAMDSSSHPFGCPGLALAGAGVGLLLETQQKGDNKRLEAAVASRGSTFLQPKISAFRYS